MNEKRSISVGAFVAAFTIAGAATAYGLREQPVLAAYACIVLAVLGGACCAAANCED